MRIITLEDHFDTALSATNLPKDEHYLRWIRDRGAFLGHDIDAALDDIGTARIAAMDAAGIDLQILSLTTPGAQAFESDLAIRVATDANDRIQAAINAWPGRFEAFASLPTADPAAAVRELDRTITELGFKGVLINSHTRESFLDDRKYWPIFERAQALDVPVYLHPSDPLPALTQSYFKGFEDLSRPAWGFGIDASTHFLRILFSGVFDAYPRLQFILGHMGEGLPFAMERIVDHTSYVAQARGLKRTPAECLRENLVITTSGSFSVPSAMCAIEILGLDRVMFSVDWPYESNLIGVDFLKRLPLSPADLEKVASGNATRILRL